MKAPTPISKEELEQRNKVINTLDKEISIAKKKLNYRMVGMLRLTLTQVIKKNRKDYDRILEVLAVIKAKRERNKARFFNKTRSKE